MSSLSQSYILHCQVVIIITQTAPHSHQRMNAVRMRKENQVISAEEKRLLLTHASEQRLKRENEIISGFRDILSERQKK